MRHRSISPKPYLQLLAILFLLLSLPRETNEAVRGFSAAILAPAWNQLASIKQAIQHLSKETFQGQEGSTLYVNEEVQKLQMENQLLKNEIAALKGLLKQESFLEGASGLPDLHLLREKEREIMVSKQLQSIPAQVIFRSSGSWKKTLWINVGKAHNEQLGKEVISKNSPVVAGIDVVGVIDYVGDRQSRVRLITDPSLTPSVRAVRVIKGKARRLAKGELQGVPASKCRTQSDCLVGTGFNYDFPDREGPARDLRTGEVLGNRSILPLPIILPDDLLITTGMDGIFPAGLSVAKVSRVKTLKEGDYYYEAEALPCCGNFDHLTLVSVLPSQGFDPSDQP